jgi:hypothetical protein
MPDLIRTHITFGLRSDSLNPQEVTSLLGILPSHSFSKGDRYNSSAGIRERPFGVWQLRSELHVSSSNVQDHVDYILQQLENKQEILGLYLTNPDYYVDIRVWWECPSETGGFAISSSKMQRLASICKEFNFTFIATCDDEDATEEKVPGLFHNS